MAIERFTGEHRFLSNFYTCEFEYAGVTWKSSEHAYQAMKTLDHDERKKIHDARDAGHAKKLGRQLKLREGWEGMKLAIMQEIVDAKFSQNQDLREKLLATDGHTLVESNDWGDKVWGVCDGVGKNLLGHVLMETRARLKSNDS